MNYGRVVRILRIARGMNLQELAKKAGVGDSQLSLVENGKRSPSLGTLERICEALDISMLHMVALASGAAIEPQAAVAILTSIMREPEVKP